MTNQTQTKPSATPAFDPVKFRKALMTIFIPMIVAFGVLGWAPQILMAIRTGSPSSAGFVNRVLAAQGPVVIGPVAFGGLAIGLIAVGGMAIGCIAVGGGAIGIIAIGGGAVGLLAFGGGSVGLVAIGGGAVGRYVLAGDGWGTYILSYKRQDRTAAEFFCQWFPPLRQAFPLGIAALDSAQSTQRRRTS
jgi:hypothetical protein